MKRSKRHKGRDGRGEIEGAPNPQIDIGTFPCRQDHAIYEIAWGYRPEDYEDDDGFGAELWALYRPGMSYGCRRPSETYANTRIRLTWRNAQFNNHDPYDAVTRNLFLDYARLNTLGTVGMPEPDDYLRFIAHEGPKGVNGSAGPNSGVLGAGFYSVYQEGALRACGFHPALASARREAWVLLGIDDTSPAQYQRCGMQKPSTTLRFVRDDDPQVDDGTGTNTKRDCNPNSEDDFVKWATEEVLMVPLNLVRQVFHRLDAAP